MTVLQLLSCISAAVLAQLALGIGFTFCRRRAGAVIQ